MRLSRLLWMYANLFYYMKPWHQYLIQTDNNFGHAISYNDAGGDPARTGGLRF